jgi:hypothetical protein
MILHIQTIVVHLKKSVLFAFNPMCYFVPYFVILSACLPVV